MIVSMIRQFGLRLRADPEEIPFQYSSNIQMQFIKDENYNDYTVVGYYIPPGQHEAKLLSINDDGTFILGPDCFKQRGTLSFSFNLINSQEEVHLGSIDFEVRYSFGDGDTILPEPEEVWISLVTQVAKDAIKEDVELVKQKANEALQSTSLANDKANEAQEYANNANQSANSASLSASSALTAKNDAKAASNSAIQAKQDAEQSANNAKNSANTALKNANASNKAIETVTQIKTEIENKANDFDTNYQEKLKSFNDNATSKQNAFDNSVQTANTNFDNKVTQANSDLDNKITSANSLIDEKVTEATNQANEAKKQAQIATDEVAKVPNLIEGKLDKNLGLENKDKVLVTDAEGNVITQNKEDFEGGGTTDYNSLTNKPSINGIELSGNKTSSDLKMYTQEEVDYLLDDKMDKPYYDISITDNTTIENTLAGNFKIDSIEGNIYQAEESGIVPTPERPVPIRSKKITVDGEIVELRSLKESKNVFDLNFLIMQEEKTWELNQSYGLAKTLALKLKPNTQYIASTNASGELTGDANTNRSLYFSTIDDSVISSNSCAVISGRNIIKTSNSNGELRVTLFTTRENAQQFINGEAWVQIEEGSSATSYVPATVRDYKIVYHTTKTSKIIRNIGLFECNFSTVTSTPQPGDIGTYRYNFAVNNVRGSRISGAFSETAEHIYYDSRESEHFYCNDGIISFWSYTSDLKIKSNVVAPLKTPTEESIPYVKTDASEVGLSWQDTTSPSPDIESKIYEVDEINVRLVGKNFIDINYISNIENWTNSNTDGYYYIPIAVPKNAQLVISNDVKVPAGRGYFANFSPYKEKNAENYYFIYHNVTGSALGKFTSITKSNVVYLRLNSINVNLPSFVEDFKKMQLEIGSVATPYEPYQEISIQHTLSKPLRATKDGSVRDAIDIVNMQTTYNITDFTVDGNTTIALGTDKEKTRVIQINTQPFLNPTNNLKMYCDKLLNDSGKDEELFTVSIALFIAINKNRVEANDINAFKKWFGENPLYFIGISKTPTTEPLEDELVEKLKTLKTFSPVTHVFVEGVAKPKLNARYPKDIAAAQAQLEAKVITLQEAVIKNV